MWNNFYYNTGVVSGGNIVKIYIEKEIDMEIIAEQNKINAEVAPEYLGVDFEVEVIKKEIKIEATWQRN